MNPITKSLLTAAACVALTAVGSAQVLLSTADYAVLGGTLISVGGPGPNTIVNGNVGLSPSATSNITGFPPAVVSGNTLSGPAAAIIATGGATSQARLDLIKAQNALAAMPSNVNVSNVDLGTMAALGPGVYTFNGAATQTGALVLDAQGQNGVSWVFQIGTSLTTSVNSTVTIINLGSNGGTDLGVYWNVGTAINFGDNNTIVGNYLAGTSISFTGITTTLGAGGSRALALAAVSFAGPGAINPLGGPGGGDWDGGLDYNGLGQLVAIVAPVVPGPGPVPTPAPVIAGNVLLSTTGSFVAGPSGVTLTPGTSYPTTTLTIDGAASNGSAPASLTINTATVTLTGTNTYTGGTIVNTGDLLASAANLPANQGVTLNNSTLTFVQPTDGTFGGVVSGNGSVVKQGAGALTLSGANAHTGGTRVSAGSLIVNTATLPANRDVAVASGATLVFNQAANGTFGGTIGGSGTLEKRGAGVLTLANTTATTLDLQAGSLIFTGGLGHTTIASGATLGGSGTIIGNLTNRGRLSPGTSPGTINLIGNYVQSGTGSLLVEIASATSFDKLLITGTANLAGTVLFDLTSGYNPLGQSFTFLTATGGVTGTFGTVTGATTTSAATRANLTYAPNSVTLAFTQLPFAGFAQTPNQAAVGAAGQGVPVITTALNVIPSAAQFPGALNALSPQGYQAWSNIAFAHGTALADRLARNPHAQIGDDNFYFDVSQRRGRVARDADVGTTTATSTGYLVGGDRAMNANLNVGIFYEHAKTVTNLGTSGSLSTIKENMIGARTAWVDGPMFAHAMLAYGFDDYKSRRAISFPGTTAIASSTTRGHQWLAGISGGRHVTFGSARLSPFIGLLASRWTANGFTESGAGALNASLASQSARSLRSEAGVEAALNWNIGSIGIVPHARAAWLHEFSDESRRMGASFGGVGYAVSTRAAQRNSALLSGGLDLVINPRALIYAGYSVQTGSVSKILSEWRVGVNVKF